MLDLIADGWAEILHHVRSQLLTVCPRLDQGPISHADELVVAVTLAASLVLTPQIFSSYIYINCMVPGTFSSP